MMSRTLRDVTAALVLVVVAGQRAGAQCPGDVIPNGVVNGVDLAEVLANWGPCSSCAADTSGDGQVNAVDLAFVLGGWGPCRPVITSVSPQQSHVNGGNLITLTGHYLSSTSSVTFGGVPAASFVVVSGNTLRAVTPPGTIGSVAVVVTTAAGAVSPPGQIRYVQVAVPTWASLIEAEPDPAVVSDPALRASITANGYAWRVKDTATDIEMLLIPQGAYPRGCSPSLQSGCYSEESPVHQVTLTQPFYMGRYEVTQAQWAARMGSNPSGFQSASAQVPASQVPNRPVERVSWNMIQGFLSATGMRLPTEAEWEWAYRAGTTTAYHSMPGYPDGTNDDALVGNIAWFNANANSQTRPVGGKAGNGFGLHDMSGNVWEWVHDWYGAYPSAPQVDPMGPVSGSNRVIRGCSWDNEPDDVRSSYRGNAFTPMDSNDNVGFRVARTP